MCTRSYLFPCALFSHTATKHTKGATMQKGNVKALIPIGVFLVLYLGLGILFEYGMNIPMGFYNIPIVVIFLVALLVACFQNPKLTFDEKLSVMGKGIGDKTIVTMILIFMTAGIFVGTVGRDSAESVAYLLLSIFPTQLAVVVLFVVSCFVSISMGTSVGTITLITPIAIAVSALASRSVSALLWAVRCSATTSPSSPIPPSPHARVKGARCQTSSAKTLRLLCLRLSLHSLLFLCSP